MKGYNFPANIQLAVNFQTFCLLSFFLQLLCIRILCPICRGFWEALKIELVNLDRHTVTKGEKKKDFHYNNFTKYYVQKCVLTQTFTHFESHMHFPAFTTLFPTFSMEFFRTKLGKEWQNDVSTKCQIWPFSSTSRTYLLPA